MKEFLHNYSYSSIKMFVNQFAISIFGAMLSMATSAAANNTLSIVVSVISILFYLFLIYTVAWEVGAKDRISVDIGKKKYRPHTGLLVSLVANIPNFLIAIVFTAFSPFKATNTVAGGVCVVTSVLTLLLEGMYLGVTTSISIGAKLLNTFWWSYFLIILPAMMVSWVGYYLGFKNKKLTTLFDYQAPDKAKKK
ncbi:MAG: hypothetical protein E7679_06105 [Ruminococcaceae bacterium]|nr:hypothetical protein [Oscillospiraceae bacterium]